MPILKSETRRRLRLTLGTLSVIFAAAWIRPAAGQFDPRFLESYVVRVWVKAPDTESLATGFLWKQRDRVVTSLHALTPDSRISVECMGVRQPAQVLQVLRKADLALLQVSGFDRCLPFTEAQEQPPAPNTDLHTFGFYGAAHSGTSRRLSKGYATDETIKGIVGGEALTALENIGMPATDLPIYYVEAGLLPGYSGAPVVDTNRRLVGIADGGLDNGQSSYNWVIPARNLGELLRSNQTALPAAIAPSNRLFSARFATADASSGDRAVLDYQQCDWHYTWVKTKTRSLAELIGTSDDPQAIRELLGKYQEIVRRHEGELRFDIYEDQTLGLIIALPAGQNLRFDAEGPSRWLVSEANPARDGRVWFQQLRRGISPTGDRTCAPPRPTISTDGGGITISGDPIWMMPVSDPRYFDELVAHTLRECQSPDRPTCELDSRTEATARNGNKILRAGFVVRPNPTSALESYDYYSYVVQNGRDVAFQAHAHFSAGEDDLFRCAANPRAGVCSGSRTALTQLTQLVAVQLTTFVNRGLPAPPSSLSLQ